MMEWSYFRKGVVCMMLGSFMGMSTACFGPFNLTKSVYHWNSGIKGSGEVNDKWMKELVFFGMIVVPVYMFSALLDAFIFNSIQFWSGDNPIKASDLDDDGQIKVAQIGDLTMRWTSTSEGATVTYERSGIIERRAMIVSSATGYRLINETGALLAEAEMGQDGSVTLLDPDCQVVRQWTSDQLSAMAGDTKYLK